MAAMIPIAGQCREKISIQAETATPDGGGGFTRSWAAITGGASLSARVTPVTGLERATALQAEGQEMFDVWVRYNSVTSGVSKAMRVVWRGRNLNIRAIRNPDERRIWLHLACEEVAQRDGSGA